MTAAEEVKTYLDGYRESGPKSRNVKRASLLLEAWKWNAIKEGIRKIDLEEATG